MNKIVNPSGPINANLMIVGEAPSFEEEFQNKPFVGPSGRILRYALQYNKFNIEEAFVTNVINYKVNDIEKENLEPHKKRLFEEIQVVKPNCILALGSMALKALTGLTSITSWRGSIIQGNGYKIVPAIHPASFIYDAQWYREVVFRVFDVRRAIRESETKRLDLPERYLQLIEKPYQLENFLSRIKQKVSVDIETSRTIPVCIALASSKSYACSVPLLQITTGKYQTVRLESGLKISSTPVLDQTKLKNQAILWYLSLNFFSKDTKIIGQNFKFDQEMLARVKFKVNSPYSDTMLKAHTCYPEFPKSLQFLTSVFTREPYYKDEGKEYDPRIHDFTRLMKYNAKDAAVTFEVDDVLEDVLIAKGLKDFYYNYVMKLHDFYKDIESVGILLDDKKVNEESKRLLNKYIELNSINTSIIGHEFNPISPKQCQQIIYKELRCPKRHDTSEESIMTILNPQITKNQDTRTVLENILQLRKIRKALGTYICANKDDDDRIHTSYKIVGTETGRSSCTVLGPPLRIKNCGWPFQQISKGKPRSDINIKSLVIADSGYTFIEMDKSQAEGRVVALLSRDYELLSSYDKLDVHSLTAAPIYGKSYEEIVYEHKHGKSEMRQIGKKVRHAGNYHMQSSTFRNALIREAGIYKTENEVQEILDKFHASNPKLAGIFWSEIETKIDDDRELTTPYGRKRQFFGQNKNQVYKEAYAYIPQSTVPDSLRMNLLDAKGELDKLKFYIVQECHDSILALCIDEEVYEAISILKKYQEREIDFSICSLSRSEKLIIPVEFKIGKNWGELHELDR